MPRTITYSCSVCGKAKQIANRWFVVTNTRVGFHLNTWEWAVRDDVLDDERTEYICGADCAHRLLDKFMGNSMALESKEE